MYENVKQARKIVNLMMFIYIGISITLILTFFIRFGIGEGIYRVVTIGIGTITAIALFNAIKEGSIGARLVQGTLSLISALMGLYLVFFIKHIQANVLGEIFMSVMSLYFLLCGIFLLFSPQINAIRKYYKIFNSLDWLWSWNGKCIGYQDKGFLWSSDGQVIGKFIGNEIFSPEGKYLGELYKNNNRLCVDPKKVSKSIETFEVVDSNYRIEKKQNISSLVPYSQYEDFKSL